MIKKVIEISGMHCVSCAINIDGELEDTKGVFESNTNYAKQKTQISFDPKLIEQKEIVKIIKNLGYDASFEKISSVRARA